MTTERLSSFDTTTQSHEVGEGEGIAHRATFGAAYDAKKSLFGAKATVGSDGATEGGALTVNTASFNLANNIIGAGLVGLSFVNTSAGVIPFLVFMTIAGVGTVLTLDMLAAGADMHGVKDFEGIAEAAAGTSVKWLSSIAICIQCYGACIAYLVLIASTSPVVGKLLGFEIDPLIIQIGITVGIVLPLCLLKDLSALSITAMFALVVYLSVALFTIYNGFSDNWYAEVGQVDGSPRCPVEAVQLWPKDVLSMAQNFPTILFAFVCHPTALPVFAELQGGQVESMKRVNRISIGIAYVLYVSVGLFGYIAYTNNTYSSVLLNLRHCVCKKYTGDDCTSACDEEVCADDNIMASILNFLFLLAVITGYPSVHFALRRSLIAMFWGSDKEFTYTIHYSIAFANVAATLLIAVVAGDVSPVFNWAGSIASPMLGFVLPGILFNGMVVKTMKTYPGLNKALGTTAFIFGIFMICVGVGLQIRDILSD